MKKCIVCGKAITGEVCGNCSQFLKWKYGKGYKKKIAEFRKLSSTKCNRRIK